MRQLKLLKLVAFAALALPGVVAMAADGTVIINGVVSNQTCTISVSGGAASNSVSLPEVSRSALSAIGATAGATAFTISVRSCVGRANFVNTFFEPGSGSVNAAGRLGNTGPATGVDVQITTDAGAVVDMSKSNGSQGTTATRLIGSAGTQNYVARYYATAATGTPGTFTGSFSYSIVYP